MSILHHVGSGWWSAWLAREHLRFPHAGALHRIWVQPAAAPEDYRFENLAWRVRANMGIQVRANMGIQVRRAFMVQHSSMLQYSGPLVSGLNHAHSPARPRGLRVDLRLVP